MRAPRDQIKALSKPAGRPCSQRPCRVCGRGRVCGLVFRPHLLHTPPPLWMYVPRYFDNTVARNWGVRRRPSRDCAATDTHTHTHSRYILRTHTHTHTHRHTDTPWPTTVRCRRRDKDTVLVSILVGSCRAVARDEGPGWRPDRQTTDGLFDTAQAVVMRPAGLCRALASVPSRTERT